MDKSISAAFFKVRRKDENGHGFRSCLRAAWELDSPERQIDSALLRLARLTQDGAGHWIAGEFIRRQVSNLPPKLRDTGEPEPLGLPAGYGLGHGVAFRYYHPLRVLLAQQNRNGAGLTRINHYLSDVNGSSGFEFEPVLANEALVRLTNTQSRKLRIRVADPENLDAAVDSTRSVRESLRNLKEIAGGAFVEAVISMGRREGELQRSHVRQVVNWLIGNHAEHRGGVTMIRVEGTEAAGDGAVLLDFISARMGAKATLDLDDADVGANYNQRRIWLRSTFNRHLDDLTEQFGRD